MSLKKRIKNKIKDYSPVAALGDRVHDKVSGFASNVGDKVSDAAKRVGTKAKEGYQRYKDPLIIGAATALGAILGTVVPGVGTVAGAGLGLSLSSAAVGANKARKEQQAAKQAQKEFLAQTGGLEGAGPGSIADALRRRRLRRGAGEGVAEFESEAAGQGDTHETGSLAA